MMKFYTQTNIDERNITTLAIFMIVSNWHPSSKYQNRIVKALLKSKIFLVKDRKNKAMIALKVLKSAEVSKNNTSSILF